MPDVRSRLLIRQRTATVTIEQAPCHAGAILTDGSDLVPAPTARILSRPNRKLKRAYEEDWLVELANSRAGMTGAEGPAMGPDPKPRRVIFVADGASRGNPGPAAWAYLVYDTDGHELLHDSGLIDGDVTNMVAEYHAVIAALSAALDNGWHDVAVRTDCQTVAHQLLGVYRARHPDMRRLQDEANRICDMISEAGGTVTIWPVSRAQTRAADQLANIALDEANDGAA